MSVAVSKLKPAWGNRPLTLKEVVLLSIIMRKDKLAYKGQIKLIECLAVPGHSVEEVEMRGGKRWKPTRLIQETDERGWRTGERRKDLSAADESALLGGGNAVTIAAAQLFDDLETQTYPRLKLLIFAAGRPAYLGRTPPGYSEGEAMLAVFRRKAETLEEAKDVEIVIQKENLSSRDDVFNSLRMAYERGLKSIAFLLMDFRIDREKEFLRLALEEHPEYRCIAVECLSAENILFERYKDNPARFSGLNKMLKSLKSSKAFARSTEMEKGGTVALRKGTYRGKGNY